MPSSTRTARVPSCVRIVASRTQATYSSAAQPPPLMATTPTKNRHRARLVVGGIVAVELIVVGGTYVDLHFVLRGPLPKRLLSPVTTPSGATGDTGSSGSLAGTWKVGSGSTAGYRVGEQLFGQSNTAVGRTDQVTGSMTIAGTTVTKATVTVDMASVKSVG